MARSDNKSVIFKGRIPGLGVTYFERNGKVYARTSTRKTPETQTFKQFVARSRMRHAIALWNAFDPNGKPPIEATESLMPYNVFLKANAGLPTVYLTKAMSSNGCALLMHQMVVCEGRLPEVECRFETLDNGRRVVMTNLNTRIPASEVRPLSIATSADAFHLLGLGKTNPQISQGSVLRFYRFEQQMNDGYPKVVVDCCDLVMEEDCRAMPTLSNWHFLSVGGHLAIADVDDENKGWAVVLYDPQKGYASSQQVLTNCRLYEQFATEEAAKEAANSYGNVVGPMMLVPNE